MPDGRDSFAVPPEAKSDVLREAWTVNHQRSRLTAAIVALLDAAYFLWFRLIPEGSTPAEIAWHRGIETTHALSLAAALAFLLVSYLAFRTPRSAAALLAFEVPFLVWLFALGIVLSAIDQAVTPSITPFLVVCLAAGAIFYHRPLPSAALFVAAYLVFHFAIGSVDRDPAQLVSNRINGLTGAALGFGVSLAFWRLFLQTRGQRTRIEEQRQELARVNRELEHMAFHDSLTGLPNRRWFDRAVRAESSAARRRGTATSLIVIDLDHFKALNDTYGHPLGDDVLQGVARVLTDHVRVSDTVARLGGEEFIILLPDTPLDGARALAEKLREKVAAAAFPNGESAVKVTASFGVAALEAGEGRDAVHSYAAADAALYRAKNLGRNRVEVEA
jgi:diguanylate cyclase